jgi:hypothetical protein
MLEINSQLDNLNSLTHSLEPIGDNEINLNHIRTKFHHLFVFMVISKFLMNV